MVARYDGLADWYDAEFYPSPLEGSAWETVARLLGKGMGELLDVGCGTGHCAAALAGLGWNVTGVDLSEDMLGRARERRVRVVQADAAQLPFEAATFDAAVSMLTHTDFDDFAAAVGEIVRVLRPRGSFVYVGVHPCFVGPHSRYELPSGLPELYPGWYRRLGRYTEAPGIQTYGVRAKIGATHLPLAAFLQIFLDAGLTLERVEEPEERDYPHLLALRLRR
jgi:ubiquinone/menaquinone biosynthesis C-methylase UbiE